MYLRLMAPIFYEDQVLLFLPLRTIYHSEKLNRLNKLPRSMYNGTKKKEKWNDPLKKCLGERAIMGAATFSCLNTLNREFISHFTVYRWVKCIALKLPLLRFLRPSLILCFTMATKAFIKSWLNLIMARLFLSLAKQRCRRQHRKASKCRSRGELREKSCRVFVGVPPEWY